MVFEAAATIPTTTITRNARADFTNNTHTTFYQQAYSEVEEEEEVATEARNKQTNRTNTMELQKICNQTALSPFTLFLSISLSLYLNCWCFTLRVLQASNRLVLINSKRGIKANVARREKRRQYKTRLDRQDKSPSVARRGVPRGNCVCNVECLINECKINQMHVCMHLYKYIWKSRRNNTLFYKLNEHSKRKTIKERVNIVNPET